MTSEKVSVSDEEQGDHEPLSDPASWVDRHGDALFRYARLHLGDQAAAEDVVQETFLAALRARGTFAGLASERSWLVGILKHKIADSLRAAGGVRTAGDEGCELDGLFDGHGKWKARPRRWEGDPKAALEQKEFWAAFHGCLARLPGRLAAVFSLTYLDALGGGDVCQMLDITEANLWVSLYRARLGLVRCLEANWFRGERNKR